MPELDVICIGSVTVDTIAVVPSIPGEDERVLASDMLTAGGGPAATAAVALARLGARVGFCGVVGDDDAGRMATAELEREGIDLTWLKVDAAVPTARSCILVSERTSGRTIVAQRAPEPSSPDIPLTASRWLHVDQTGIRATMTAVTGAASPPRVSFDGGNPVSVSTLAGIALYVPTVERLRQRYPLAASVADAARAAMAGGADAVVATDGSRDTIVCDSTGIALVESFSVPVRSTLGAGDVFHGALLASLLRGSSHVDAAREASAAAAMSCRSIDGRSGIPDRRALDDFIATGDLVAAS